MDSRTSAEDTRLSPECASTTRFVAASFLFENDLEELPLLIRLENNVCRSNHRIGHRGKQLPLNLLRCTYGNWSQVGRRQNKHFGEVGPVVPGKTNISVGRYR